MLSSGRSKQSGIRSERLCGHQQHITKRLLECVWALVLTLERTSVGTSALSWFPRPSCAPTMTVSTVQRILAQPAPSCSLIDSPK